MLSDWMAFVELLTTVIIFLQLIGCLTIYAPLSDVAVKSLEIEAMPFVIVVGQGLILLPNMELA